MTVHRQMKNLEGNSMSKEAIAGFRAVPDKDSKWACNTGQVQRSPEAP